MTTRTANRLMSFFSAAFVTVAMLAAVNMIATAETGAPLWTQAAPAAKA